MNRRNFLAAVPAVLTTKALSNAQYLPLIQTQGRAQSSDSQAMLPSGLGVGCPWQTEIPMRTVFDELDPPWWYDWRWENCADDRYLPMIWSDGVWRQQRDVLEMLFKRWPDKLWMLWNEPERRDQANMDPAEAAALTHEIAAYGIHYAAAGIALTSAGFRWMDAYMAAGGPVPDCWHVHIYEASPNDFDFAWNRWRQWMTDNNAERPTIISECNGYTQGVYRQIEMVQHIQRRIEEDELMQAAGWFATRFPMMQNSWLFNEDNQLTDVGRAYVARV